MKPLTQGKGNVLYSARKTPYLPSRSWKQYGDEFGSRGVADGQSGALNQRKLLTTIKHYAQQLKEADIYIFFNSL